MKKVLVGTLAIALAFGLPACGGDDSTGPDGSGETADLTVAFAPEGIEPSPEDVVPPAGRLPGEVGASVVRIRPAVDFAGSNGTLTIDEIRVVVSDFALEAPDGNCSGAVGCARFPGAPLATPIPLSGGSVPLVEAAIEAGSYDELQFEVEDLEADQSGDDDKAADLAELLQELRADVADWPEKGSIYVTGQFTPTDGEATPFRTFLEVESEVSLSFGAPLAISDEDSGDQLVIRISPARWFSGEEVVDLSQYDFDATGEAASFSQVAGSVADGFLQVAQESGGPAF